MGHRLYIFKRAFAVIEYVMLITIVCAALIAFRVYIQRSLQGQYRKAGESAGLLRQYDPGATIDCVHEVGESYEITYSRACFNNKVVKLKDVWGAKRFCTSFCQDWSTGR